MKLKALSLFSKIIHSENELTEVIDKLNIYLSPTSILLLSGQLAAGKTTLTRHLCEFYSLSQVQSPTYAIHHRYENRTKIIDHFDLYRLNSAEDLVSTGFWDFLNEQKSLIIIEWFEKIGNNDWLEFEAKKRTIFGCKIETLSSESRHIEMFQLTP